MERTGSSVWKKRSSFPSCFGLSDMVDEDRYSGVMMRSAPNARAIAAMSAPTIIHLRCQRTLRKSFTFID
jgi:hypothetical protein